MQNFAQVLPSPSPTPPQRPTPGPDVAPVVDALNPQHLFSNLLTMLAQQFADALQTIADRLWHSGINVFTYTDPSLTYSFGPVAALLLSSRLLIGAITGMAIVFAAASLAGREVFGWGGELGEHIGRIGLAATLANGAGILIQLAIDFNNQLCEAIGSTAMQAPFGDFNFDPLADSILLIALLLFGLRLGFKMVYRVGMLWVLIPMAPIALACWALPQTQWIATTWTRMFVGWTFGQVLVTIALKLGTVVGPLGPSGMHDVGFIFSIAMAALACDLADVLVRTSGAHFGGGASRVLRTALAVRQAFAGVARIAHSPQLRMPGF